MMYPSRAPDYMAMMHLVRTYGITKEQAQVALVSAQGDICACCGQFRKRLILDHNHRTGSPRGMVCHGCNTAVGFIEGPRYQKALAYIASA